jgi:hypothetical protein
MFQLFDLFITSPLGVLALSFVQDLMYAALMASDCEACAFDDLGKLLLGGVAAAILVGIGISLWFRRKKDRGFNSSEFVSIRSTERKP